MGQIGVDGYQHEMVALPGLHTHYVSAGPRDGFPVILLHGFPEFWYSWRYQIPALVKAGYRVIAPDQRGYNLSGKQPPYTVDTLVEDIAYLQEALGIQTSHFAGHDWGGVVAFAFAVRHPERVERLVVLNAPHLPAYIDTVKRHPVQLLKSYYVYFFQIPRLPEWSLRQNNYRAIATTFQSLPAAVMSPADIQAYKTACAQPGALPAMIGWYRANFSINRILNRRQPGSDWHINRPTLVMWGNKDPFLDRRCNETLPRYIRDLSIRFFPDAGHWIMMENACAVNERMLDFFSAV